MKEIYRKDLKPGMEYRFTPTSVTYFFLFRYKESTIAINPGDFDLAYGTSPKVFLTGRRLVNIKALLRILKKELIKQLSKGSDSERKYISLGPNNFINFLKPIIKGLNSELFRIKDVSS